MKEIKLIIFDLDGTLIDAYAAISASFNYTMRSLGYPAQNKRVIRQAVGWGDMNLLKPFVKRRDLKEALSLYRRHHAQALLNGARLFPAAKKVLAYVRGKGYKLAVASNRPSRFSWILIRHLGLARYFQYVLCADKVRRGKPNPEILKKIMHRFYCRPEETLYVGDMAIDAQAGRRAGIRTVVVTTGSSNPKELRKQRPYRIASKISGLLKIL